jgi:hypothetical protein
VITARNFLLAFLYAEYKGNQDRRRAIYAAGRVPGALASGLSRLDVTTESFTGTIRFSKMRAFPDPSLAGAVDVSECFSNARSANVGLHTGRNKDYLIPDTTRPDQNHYRNAYVLAADRSATGTSSRSIPSFTIRRRRSARHDSARRHRGHRRRRAPGPAAGGGADRRGLGPRLRRQRLLHPAEQADHAERRCRHRRWFRPLSLPPPPCLWEPVGNAEIQSVNGG